MQRTAASNPSSFCSGSCVATIADFYADCSGDVAAAVRQSLQTGKYSRVLDHQFLPAIFTLLTHSNKLTSIFFFK